MGLIDGLDNVVLDAIRIGARNEVADDHRLLDPARIGIVHVVAGAWPAELGNHNALARIDPAQLVIGCDREVDRLSDGAAVPVGQDVGGDVVNVRCQPGRIVRSLLLFLSRSLFRFARFSLVEASPDVVCLAGGDRHRNLPLDALDNVDQVIDLHVVAQDCLVTDHDRIDVAVALGERDRLIDFTVIAGDIFFDRLTGFLVGNLVEPDANRDLHAELSRDGGHKLQAAGRRIGADGARVGTEQAQIATDLLWRWHIAAIGILPARVGRIGNAGEWCVYVRNWLLPVQQSP